MKDLIAYTVPGSHEVQVPNGVIDPGTVGIGRVVEFGLGILLAVAVLSAVGAILWGAVQWITSAGDKEKVKKARGTIVAAIIGLIIVLLAFVIIATIGTLTGSQILKDI